MLPHDILKHQQQDDPKHKRQILRQQQVQKKGHSPIKILQEPGERNIIRPNELRRGFTRNALTGQFERIIRKRKRKSPDQLQRL